MKYVLHLTDIHGNIQAVRKIARFLEARRVMPSAVFITGDSAITTPVDMILHHVITRRNLRRSDYARGVYGRYRSIFNKKQQQSLLQLDRLFRKLKWTSVFWIPGNTETKETIEFMNEELSHWTLVHERVIEVDGLDVVVSGHGFSLEHRGSHEIEYTMSDGEFYQEKFEMLVTTWLQSIQDDFEKYRVKRKTLVLLTHEFPSFVMPSSRDTEYRAGSSAILKAIQLLRPHLALFGHFHELPILSNYGNAILMNPGPAMEYCFGLISLDANINDQLELKKIERIRLNPDKVDPILLIYSKRPQLEQSSVKWLL